MGQKVNPIILRLGNKIDWKYQYFEKKTIESAAYAFKTLEIENFIIQFFKTNGLTVQDIKLYHFDNTLHIFVSYFLTSKTIFLKNFNNNTKKISSQKKNLTYKKLKYLKNLSKATEFQTLVSKQKNKLKTKRIEFLKYSEKNFIISSNTITNNNNFFVKKLLESVSIFVKKHANISITLEQLNKDVKQKINLKEQKSIKKNLIKLRKYKQNKFFKEGINTLFTCIQTRNSAKLLSKFIALELRNLKRHNFFLKFIKTSLTLFHNKDFTNCKGIKIQVKGRFNGAPRARHKFIFIGNGVPILCSNSKIDYAETTSFTPNGTFGVKVWIHEKNN